MDRQRGDELRSLDRRSMYRIFAPLDPNERLPRELLLERRPSLTWGLRLGRRNVAGFLWVPVFFGILAVLARLARGF